MPKIPDTQLPPPRALLAVVTGQKGGVGKTIIALLLANVLTDLEIVWSGIDTDIANQTFADLSDGLAAGVSIYDTDGIFVPEAMNAIVDELANKSTGDVDDPAEKPSNETIIMDVAAGQLPALISQMKKRQLLGKKTIVIPMTLVYVLINDPASISTLTNQIEIADGLAGVSWIVVLNERDGPVTKYTGRLSDDPEMAIPEDPTRTAMRKRNAVEVRIPGLYDREVFNALRDAHITPTAFCERTSNQPWSYRGQLITWLDDGAVAFLPHMQLLTNSNASAIGERADYAAEPTPSKQAPVESGTARTATVRGVAAQPAKNATERTRINA